MPYFDQLPPELRVALTKLNFNFNAEHVLILHQRGKKWWQIIEFLHHLETTKHNEDAATGEIMGGQLK